MKVLDKEIQKQFEIAGAVRFSARSFNYVSYRCISFGNLGQLPLGRVLPLIGIKPQMLRPVFSPSLAVKKVQARRPFPLNLVEAIGFLKNKDEDQTSYQVEEVELPEIIETYEQLGGFPLKPERFQILAQVLGKPVRVSREEGGTGHHYPLFTAHPSVK